MDNLSKVKDLYDKNITTYGCVPESVGWGTQEKIDLRFSKLFSVVQEAVPFSLNELGCGYGEAVKYAQKKNFQISHYRGYDISEKMIEAADKYLAEFPAKELLVKSKLDMPGDYAMASGIFNVRFNESENIWDQYILDTLSNLNAFSTKGFSFNMLTRYVDFQANDLYYADPLFYFDYCKKHFSKYVNLLHDYKLYEFTITVVK